MESELPILQEIAEKIGTSDICWFTIAEDLGFNRDILCEIRNKANPKKSFVNSLTKRIWYDILHHLFDIELENSNVETLPGIQKLSKRVFEERARKTVQGASTKIKDCSHHINIIDEISRRITEWRTLGRILDLDMSCRTIIESMDGQCRTKKQIFKRNKNILMEALKTYKQKNKPSSPECWRFWRSLLSEFANGRETVIDIERNFPILISQISSYLAHQFTSKKVSFVGHPIQFRKFLKTSKKPFEIAVNIGANRFQMIHYQDIQEWSATQERYMNLYNFYKEKSVFNFHDSNEWCPILSTLEIYLKETQDNGFATKGYHVTDHLKWFHKGIYVNDPHYENYFCFIGRENLALYLTKCNNEPGHALYYSSQNFQIFNTLHKESLSKDIIQVNVLVHNDDTDVEFCPCCIKKNLFVNENILMDIGKFKVWFNKLRKVLRELRIEGNLSKLESTYETIKNLKKEVITYEALQNTESFPSFSTCGESQMIEIKKCVILPTLVQFTILHTNEKHIFIRGSYGSGKTIILRKKLEKYLNTADIFYYICCDQQSKYAYLMESIKKEYPDKLIITCESKMLIGDEEHPPTLSAILNHIKYFWKYKTVHVFIDEFPGSYISKKEVKELNKVLPHFSESYIMIALQSMEECLQENDNAETDIGYQYDLLTQHTSFKLYDLDYSMRCSFEINEFVKISSMFLENQIVPVFQKESFVDQGRFVDKEYGQEVNVSEDNYAHKLDRESQFNTKKVSFNIAKQWGHLSSNGPVSLFVLNKSNVHNTSIFKKLKKENSLPICQIYIATLEYILRDFPGLKTAIDKRKVICTYDEELYNSVYYYLQNTKSYYWTHNIKEFFAQDSQFSILLTDYASVRGYEFSNFIFLLRLGTKYLKYRMIECFTRSTTKLCIITDNINTGVDSSDEQLLNIWNNIPENFLDCFNIRYQNSKNEMQVLQNDQTLYKTFLDRILVGTEQRYPWCQPKVMQEEKIENNLYNTIKYLCKNSNIDILQEFFQIHERYILNYLGRYGNDTLLHIASRDGHTNVARYLIFQCRVNVNVQNRLHRTPLHLASLNGHVEILQMLIDSNANIDAKDQYGQTSLHLASWLGHIKIAQLLISNKANVDIRDGRVRTPLNWASWYGHAENVRLLVESKANIHAKDNYGRTSLQWSSANGHVEVVRILINNNAYIHEKINDGKTPIHLASLNGHTKVVQLLIDEKAYIHGKDNHGNTPYHLSLQQNNFEVTELLQQYSRNK